MFPFAVVSNPRLLEMFPDVFDRTHSLRLGGDGPAQDLEV